MKIWTEILKKKWGDDINRANQIKFLKKKKKKPNKQYSQCCMHQNQQKKVDKYFVVWFVPEDLTKKAGSFF